MDYASFKEKEYDRMADILREHLDMEKIYGMLNEASIN
jgi:adenosylcobyric acid synthase